MFFARIRNKRELCSFLVGKTHQSLLEIRPTIRPKETQCTVNRCATADNLSLSIHFFLVRKTSANNIRTHEYYCTVLAFGIIKQKRNLR